MIIVAFVFVEVVVTRARADYGGRISGCFGTRRTRRSGTRLSFPSRPSRSLTSESSTHTLLYLRPSKAPMGIFRRMSTLNCFYCLSLVDPRSSPTFDSTCFRCPHCGCLNRYDKHGQIISDHPAMYEEKLNQESFLKRGLPLTPIPANLNFDSSYYVRYRFARHKPLPVHLPTRFEPILPCMPDEPDSPHQSSRCVPAFSRRPLICFSRRTTTSLHHLTTTPIPTSMCELRTLRRGRDSQER